MASDASTTLPLPDPNIHTYHCLCTHLLFATTTPLDSLPVRSNSLDRAIILPLPAPPSTGSKGPHYALLLSTTIASKPQVITRSDGFEKRWLQRCGRCRIVLGYQLDWAQWTDVASGKTGRREDVIFLLPGGFLRTEDMVNGKGMGKEIALDIEK